MSDPSKRATRASANERADESGSAWRGLSYLVNRWVLNRRHLVAAVPSLDLRLKVRTRDVNGRHLYKYARYEPELTAFLRRHLQLSRADVVIDIGANIGWYSLLAERLAPAPIDIYAFEPDPDNFELLDTNLRLNASAMVTPVQAAVAEQAGALELHRYKDTNLGRHSLLPINSGESIRVATIKLDEFWQERALGEHVPRFIKIDVEGYELAALRGGRDVLARCPLLLAEYSPKYMRAGGIDPAELVTYLAGLELLPHALEEGRLVVCKADELLSSDRHRDLFWCRPGPWLASALAG